jgi:hypothetical protein
MRTVSNTLRGKLYGMNLTGDYGPTCDVKWVELIPGFPDNEVSIPNVTNVNVTTHESNFCQTCTFTVCNVNPSDLTDYGYFTPHRNDSTHGKPQNDWYQLLVPNARIRVYMGYGDEQSMCFYGFIDTITVTIEANNCVLNVNCRDVAKLLTDQTCNCMDDSVLTWAITYPVSETVTEHYLHHEDTDPNLEDIVKDICIRAGFIEADVECDATGIKLSDTLDGYFEFEDMTWDACINVIKDLTVFEFWCNEEGKIQFRMPQSTVITVEDEEVYFNGDDPQVLEHATASYYSIVVKDFTEPTTIYIRGVDYTFDEEHNSLSRTEESNIPEDSWVKVDYTYLDWIFRNGLNIIQLPLTMSHDNVYAIIRVCGEGGTTGGIESSVTVAVDNTLWDGSTLFAKKVLTYVNENLLDEAACLVVANRMATDMKERYTQVNGLAIPIPMLQLRDIVQWQVYGMIGEAYIVIGQNLTYTADGQKITHQIAGYHYQYVAP